MVLYNCKATKEMTMYDIVKSRQTLAEPVVGTYLRATGNGQQFVKVRSWDPATRSGTVQSAFRLGYGKLTHAKQCYIRPFTAHPGHTGKEWYASVECGGYNGHWTYLPVEIYSTHPDAADAYDMGRRSGKAALKGPSYWRQQTEVDWKYVNLKKKWGCPFKYERELVLAWHDGFTDATAE